VSNLEAERGHVDSFEVRRQSLDDERVAPGAALRPKRGLGAADGESFFDPARPTSARSPAV
jgi:hypothetical protein